MGEPRTGRGQGTHLVSGVASVELVAGPEEGDEAVEADAALVGDLPLLADAVVGEGGEGRARQQANLLLHRVQHLQDPDVAEVQVAVHLLQDLLIACQCDKTEKVSLE